MTNKTQLDLKKYKRFFAFGCSFTEYCWPTWADIISKEIPEYYNYGRAGAGNFYIFSALIEANKKHKFNSDDLIMVMWTAVDREDRYLNNNWIASGCVYNSIDNFYDKQFIKKYVDPRGMFLRDCTYLHAARIILQSTNFHFMSMLKFVSSGEQNISDKNADADIESYFKDDIDLILPDVLGTIANGNYVDIAKIKANINGKIVRDLHPTPIYYLEYLQKIFDCEYSSATIDFVNEHEEKLDKLEFMNFSIYPYYERPPVERL